MPLRFRPSELFAKDAAASFAEHERQIRQRLPYVEVRHTGGTSIPGVLTTGDVDLQVRIEPGSFETARDALSELYEPHHPEVWLVWSETGYRTPWLAELPALD